MFRSTVFSRSIILLLVIGTVISAASDDLHVREIERWRQEEDDFMRSPKSPLFLSGRFIIEPGDSTLGSDPVSKIVLPEKAPGRVGTITRRGGDFHLLVTAGITVAVNEKPAAGLVSLHVASPPEPSDRIAFGDFQAAGGCGLLLAPPGQTKPVRAELQGQDLVSDSPGIPCSSGTGPF
jgi:hypothetical protein